MAIKTWLGGIGTIGYDSGGTTEPTVGDVITGQTSGAFGVYVSATVTGGSWAGGDAAGVLTLRAISGTFVEDDVLDNTTQGTTDIATIDIAGTAFTDSSGDFNIAANWSTAVVPADGDTLMFGLIAETVPALFADVTLQTIGNMFSVTETLDQSAKDFPLITVDVNYTGNIGYGLDSGTYHALRCAADFVTFAGSGNFHLVAQHASALIDKIVNTSADGSMFVGKGSTNGQKITEITHYGATLELLTAETGTLAAPELDILSCYASQGSTTIAADNSSAVFTVRLTEGAMTAYCDIAEIEICGGLFNWGADDFVPASARTIDVMVLYGGGVNWNIEGTISGLKCISGSIEVSGTGDKVLGDSSVNGGDIEVYGAILDLSGESNNISLAASSQVVKYASGEFVAPLASDVTF